MKKRRIKYPDYGIVDLKKRPDSYWPLPTTSSLLNTIKGQERREIASKMIESNELESLSEFLLKENLSENEKSLWGQFHPKMMGGEYLANLEGNEVEIVRISIHSTTYDQLSIRAKRYENMIYYSVVDEYPDLIFKPAIEKSKLPLTYGEMIYMIEETPFEGYEFDSSGLVMAVWVSESIVYDVKPPDQDADFVNIRSEFYPLLGDYYEAVFDNYVQNYIDENEDE